MLTQNLLFCVPKFICANLLLSAISHNENGWYNSFPSLANATLHRVATRKLFRFFYDSNTVNFLFAWYVIVKFNVHNLTFKLKVKCLNYWIILGFEGALYIENFFSLYDQAATLTFSLAYRTWWWRLFYVFKLIFYVYFRS